MASGSGPFALSSASFFSTWDSITKRILRCFITHRDELLGRRWVDADRRIELRLRRAELHRDRDPLDDLAGIPPDHVGSDDALGRLVDDELHERPVLALAERELEGAEGRLVDVDGAKALPCILL